MLTTRSRSYHIQSQCMNGNAHYQPIKQHPTAPDKSAYDVMANVIQAHMNDTIEAASLQNIKNGYVSCNEEINS